MDVSRTLSKSYRYNEAKYCQETKYPSVNSDKILMLGYYFKRVAYPCDFKRRKDISGLRAYVRANMTD